MTLLDFVTRPAYLEREAEFFDSQRNGCLDSPVEVLRILADFAPMNETAVLEIGCGTGFFAHHFQKSRLSQSPVIGLDGSIWMLLRSQHNVYKSCPLRCTADAQFLPFIGPLFGFAFSVKAVHQFTNRRRFFEEIDRVLVPGAHLVIVTPSSSRLQDFPLFAANPELARLQMAVLPTRADLLAEAQGTRLVLQHEEIFHGDGSVSSLQFASLIRRRFLSILFDLSTEALAQAEERTSRYLENKRHNEVMPYWQEAFVFCKEKSNET